MPEKKQIKKQSKKKSPTQYAKSKEISLQAPMKLQEPSSTLSKLYQDLRLTLDIFLECLYDNDFSRLVISGEPTELEIKSAWAKIYTEYIQLINDGSYNEMLDMIIEVNTFNAKIYLVDHIIEHLLYSGYEEKLNAILKREGLQPGLTAEDDFIVRSTKLEAVQNRAKRWIVQRDIAQTRLDALEAESKTDEKSRGRESFEEALWAVSGYRKYPVLANQTSVYTFVKALKEIERQAKLAKNKVA